MNKLGRPKGNSKLRELRSQIWYYSVKEREGLSDYALDKKFALGPNPVYRASGHRVKAFEAFRYHWSIPMTGTSNKRGFDLVKFVDSDPLYKGTARVLYSPFWKLMELQNFNVKDIRDLVVECINVQNIHQQDGNYPSTTSDYIEQWLNDIPDISHKDYLSLKFNDFDNAMDLYMSAAFPRKDQINLELIAILCCFVFESHLARNKELTIRSFETLDTYLTNYCDQFNKRFETRSLKFTNYKKNSVEETTKTLYSFVIKKVITVLKTNGLLGLPTYKDEISKLNQSNLNSPIVGMLTQIDHLLWDVSDKEIFYFNSNGKKIL